MKAAEPSFEDAVLRLEEIVAALEGGTLPLGESLRQFEEAISLSRYCAAQLEDAEAKIRALTTVSPEVKASTAAAAPVSAHAVSANRLVPDDVSPRLPLTSRSPSAGWDPFAEE